ncbi:SH3 domain-containing protein [Aureimonas populi]|uniref:SH3 domain-containing protein n=1 Tax=Aureimonas populi TaxID=1701758 RepID=A0ABW5CNH4_9HYPH|nr:SH3 domain-containing protein [Aureimonas populi]
MRRFLLAVLFTSVLAPLGLAGAQETEVAALQPQAGPQSASGLPLPRYVSLKAERVNLRVGPGRDYPVSWLYLKSGLPMEVIQEFDHWRRVRDAEGAEGWVFHSLLSGERSGIVAPWLKGKSATIDMRRSADAGSALVARMEPGVVAKVSGCSFGWCEVDAGGRKGFVSQNDLWGVYPDEKF